MTQGIQTPSKSLKIAPETPDTQARLLPFLLSNRVRARIGVRVSLALKH